MAGKKHVLLGGVGAGALIFALAATSAKADGLDLSATGTTPINDTVSTPITATSGVGVNATAAQGAIALTTNAAISGVTGGVSATTANVTTGVSVTANAPIQGGNGTTVLAEDTSTGAASITTGVGTKKAPLTFTGAANGLAAVSIQGPASVTTGAFNTFINGAPGGTQLGDVGAVGIITPSDTGGVPALQVNVGANNTLTLEGDNSAAITAHIGIPAQVGSSGSASAVINVANGVNVHVSGFTDAGVIGFVSDPSGNLAYAGTGAVSVTVGTGTILVDEVGAAGAPSNSATNAGVVALSAGGNVLVDDAASVTVDGPADATVGLEAITAGAGTSTVNARASVTSNNGDAIRSTTTNGANTVDVFAGTIAATGGDGIDAVASGSGPITIDTSAGSTVGTTLPGNFSGIFASSGSGNVTIDALGSVSDGGVLAKTAGAGGISVTTAAVTNTAGIGVSATASGSGPVSITTTGPVTASGDGVLGQSSNGSASVAIAGSVQASGADGVEAVGLGAASVTTASGATKAPLTISDPTAAGVVAFSILGQSSVMLGSHNVITAGTPGQSADTGASAISFLTSADTGGTPTASVVTGTNDTFTVQGNNSAGISAQIGEAGVQVPNGSASVMINVGNGLNLHLSGFTDAGVIGFVSDPSGANLYEGTGAVSVTVGTGTILVDEAGALGGPSRTATNTGVVALSSGGNVLVDDAATVTVDGTEDATVGLRAITSGAGTSTVNARASVTTNNGDAIQSMNGNGTNLVDVFGGTISAKNGDGIDAVASGSGSVTVDTAAGTSVGTLTPGNFSGIFASSGSGNVVVSALGVVGDGGVHASTSGSGTVSVTTAAVTNTAGHGIAAFSGSGAVNVIADGSVSGSVDGVLAQSSTGADSITTGSGTKKSPLVFTAGDTGVVALSVFGPTSVTTGAYNTFITGAPGVIGQAGVVAISVLTPADVGGVPTTQVNVGANNTFILEGNEAAAISSHPGAAGGPGPNGTASAVVNVANGVNVHVSGVGDAGVIGFVADPSGAGTYAGTGNVSVTVGTGTILVDQVGAVGNLAGGNTGIAAVSAGGNVLIDDAAAVTVDGGAGSNGLVSFTSGSGTSTINARASVSTDEGNAIVATTTNGANTIDVFAGTISATGGMGIEAVANGSGPVTIISNGAVTATGDGVVGQSSSGSAAITVNQSVQASGAVGVEALALGAGTANVTTSSGTARAPLTISDPSDGVVAFSVVGQSSVTLGSHNVITAGMPGQQGATGASAISLLTGADMGGTPTASVVTGTNDTITVQGNNSAGISAQIGEAGGTGPNGSTASAMINIGNGLNLHLSGFTDAGVIGFVTDPSGNTTYSGTGAVSVTVGTGTILVDEAGAQGGPSRTATNTGVVALSSGGNVLVDDAATVTVDGTEDATVGLRAITSGAGTSTVNARASVTTDNGDAIQSMNANGANLVDVFGGTISATNGDGIDAVASGSGPVTVDTADGTSVGTLTPGNFSGIFASSNSGAVTVDALGAVSDGGVLAQSGGSASVSVTTAAVTNTAGVGVDGAATGSGAASVISNGVVTSSGNGVLAQSGSGAASVAVNQSVAASGPVGVGAFSNAAGTASVVTGAGTSAKALKFTAPQTAIVANSLSGASIVTTGAFNTFVAGTPGVTGQAAVAALAIDTVADTGDTPSAQVDIGANNTFTFQGDAGAAISAHTGVPGVFGPNGTASVAINVANGLSLHTSGLGDAAIIGFDADPSGAGKFGGSGAVNVIVGTGSILVDENGAVGTAGGSNSGIAAVSFGGNVLVDDSASITVKGAQDGTTGVVTFTAGAGTSTIDLRASVTSNNGNGTSSTTTNGANTVEVFSGTDSAPAGSAVVAVANGSGAVQVTVDAGANLTGLAGVTTLAGAGGATVANAGVIEGGANGGVAASGAGLVTINNSGTIGGSSVQHTGLAIDVTGTGGLALNNLASGVLDGRIIASDNATLENAGLWETSGTSDFGTAAGAATNSIVNTGTIQVGRNDPASAATTSAFNDVAVTNAGIISMVNGKVGDVLSISGPYVGGSGAVLSLDASLGGPGSKADQLQLNGGSSGLTLIRINDTNTGAGALNAQGIVLVTGVTSAANFALDPSQPNYDSTFNGIDHGLFVYPLSFSNNTERLIGVPGQSAMQMATMASAVEQIWSSTTPGATSADSLVASLADGGDASNGPRLWAKSVNWGASRLNGGQTLITDGNPRDQIATTAAPLSDSVSQTSSVSALGATYGFDTSYNQNTSAMLVGLDLGRHVGQGMAWSWGLTGGYVESEQDFTAGHAFADYNGALVALNAAYVNGGFYLGGDAKMTAIKVTYLTDWGGVGQQTGTITTVGGEVEAGYKQALGLGWTVEPVGTLAVQHSSLSDLSVLGTQVQFGAANSFRVSVGAKFSGAWRLFGGELTNETTARLWNEFDGANALNLGASAVAGGLPDPIGGAFADVGDSVSLSSLDGHASAFVSGTYRWKTGYDDTRLAVGLKLRW